MEDDKPAPPAHSGNTSSLFKPPPPSVFERTAISAFDAAELSPGGAAYWLAMDGWTVSEAAHLLNAIDPRVLARWVELNGGQMTVSFPEQFDAVQALLRRAAEAGALRIPAMPADVIQWAMSKGLRLPAPLIPAGAVVRGGQWVTESPVAAPAEESNTARRARRLDRLRELGADLRAAGDGWQVIGKRGALATLVREEAAAGRAMADKTDVRADLAAAMGGIRGS